MHERAPAHARIPVSSHAFFCSGKLAYGDLDRMHTCIALPLLFLSTGALAAPPLSELSLSLALIPALLSLAESYNVTASESSVSGLSSGAFMAVQFHLAHSATLRGAGVTAGGT